VALLLYNGSMEKSSQEEKPFSIRARIRSANNAARGIGLFLRSTHNAWGYGFFILIVIYMGFTLRISTIEWIILILTMGMVILAETINTAIEIDINLTSPDYHPYARDTKDVAAGAVLITIIIACLIGVLIFIPKIIVAL
jgi:diacylglycerol kinase (ATP)